MNVFNSVDGLDGLVEQVVRVAQGHISVHELATRLFDRIDRDDDAIRAWAYIDRDAVLWQAQRQDKQRQGTTGGGTDHSLNGLIFAAKDNFDSCDLPTEYGSAIHAGFQPGRDASCIATLREQGALLLGKTVTTEFAHVHPGATRNPHDIEHTPGGSSSGSAAAVAAGMVPMAFGSQTTGSVIRPAAYCGVVGFKPTYGHLNVAGMLANAPSFDTVGIITRSVEDAAFTYGALLGMSQEVTQFALDVPAAKQLTIGVCRTPFWDRAGSEAQQTLDDAVRTLASGGCKVVDFDGQGAFDDIEALNQTISGFEFCRTLAHERRVAENQLSDQLRQGRMGSGLKVSYADYVDAQRRLRRQRDRLDLAFNGVDVAISLPAPGPAPAGLSKTGDAIFNLPWTTLHAPALTLPLFNTGPGLPMGLQLCAPRHADTDLLAAAAAVRRLFQ